MKKIFFTTAGTLNDKLNVLFEKMNRPRVRQWYAIIGDKVYFVRRDIPSTTVADMKNTPKGKVIPVYYNWGVSNEIFLESKERIAKLKKGTHVLGYKVNVSY